MPDRHSLTNLVVSAERTRCLERDEPDAQRGLQSGREFLISGKPSTDQLNDRPGCSRDAAVVPAVDLLTPLVLFAGR